MWKWLFLCLFGFSLVAPPVQAQTTNLAQGRPAAASSSENSSFLPAGGNDGSQSTRWSSGFTNTEWWSVDLGASYNVTKVVISWESAYATSYDLMVSPDNVTWTTYYTGTNSFPT